MPTLPPITKIQFLEAFKNADKYVKFNYIKQETFFCNMVYVMGVTKKNMPVESKSTLEKFDDTLFRRGVMIFLRSMEPEWWRKFDSLAEKMQADAISHLSAAGTDSIGIVLGALVNKGVNSATKKVVRQGKKVITRLSNRETKAATNNGVLARMGSSKGRRVELLETGEVRVNTKTRNNFLGTDIAHPFDKRFRKDYVIELSNPLGDKADEIIESYVEDARQTFTSEERFSFSDHMNSKAEFAIDVLGGNIKAAASAFTNLAIGYVYSKSADRLAQIEGAGKAATREYIQTHLCVDVEKDLKALDKKTLFRMLQFVPEIDNRPIDLRK